MKKAISLHMEAMRKYQGLVYMYMAMAIGGASYGLWEHYTYVPRASTTNMSLPLMLTLLLTVLLLMYCLFALNERKAQ